MEQANVNNVNENKPENLEVGNIIHDSEPESQDGDLPYSSSGSDVDSSDDDNDSMDLDDGTSDMEDLPRYLKGTYKILSFADIRQCQEDDVSNISSVLSISRAEAMILLLHFKWDIQIITEKWFADPTKVRVQVGLIESPAIRIDSLTTVDKTCDKCSGHVPEYLGTYVFCSHKYCTTCWQECIGKSVRDNRPLVRCPEETCYAAVNQDIISLLVSEADQRLHNGIVLRSYLAKKGKRCPTPGCNHAVLLESDSITSIDKFTCKCHYSYCYKCLKEAHHPICCALVETWRTEPLKQSRNWQVAYIRNCPKCDQSLEAKNWSKQMQCSACSFIFCWTCLDSWFENGRWAGEQYSHICPRENLNLNELAAEENTRAKATNVLLRYQGCFTHFSSHDTDLEQVILKLRTMQHNELKVLAEKQGLPLEEVSFVRDAWLQVAECKRVFKWASVYEFYFFAFQESRKSLYDKLIRQAAFVMDQLCIVGCELRKFIGTDPPTGQFDEFRQRLVFKTSVARNFFENMKTAVRCEYPDMEFLRLRICSREAIKLKPASDIGTSIDLNEPADKPNEQPCPHCCFPSDNTTTICIMCYH